ncbi:hypothetical protein CIRMBP1271_00509 [Enterococcus cecorum]|nr:hypothetical protein CIRMBP1240_00004 [Enterococcus cecorum]CAI3249953.1 hypothetical protein CIRMBP1232_00004 [Enterococcus cecorum]CAI3250044.1 hypothetical protein CIRMBP1235_00004 [Enterococcus cecorum]CAI3250238.1 hypothetical protein CIRMBP1226_00004 [Enterococcus cecorum]CAI3256372.1 hypothetical protein CIRMBP1267_00067 [Enterococcus cecorum]
MKFKKFIKPLLFSSLILGTISCANFSSNKVDALSDTSMWKKVTRKQKFKLDELGLTQYPIPINWNSDSRLIVERGRDLGETNYDYWYGQNRPPQGTHDYSIDVGDRYRITNVGTTKDGTKLDVIIEILDRKLNSNGVTPSITFANSDLVGNGNDLFKGAIVQLVAGCNWVDQQIKFVKSGTNELKEIATYAVWTDIDVWQGIDEKQSNKGAFYFDASDLKTFGTDVYANWGEDIDGKSTLKGSYVGIGEQSQFFLRFQAPYRHADNVGRITSFGDGYRLDVLGRPTNPPVEIVKDPPAPNAPVKTVTDGGRDVNGQTTKPDKHWVFDVAQELPAMPDKDVHYSSWELVDEIPRTADILGVKMIDEQGNDVASKFNISISGQKVTATAKSSPLADPNFYQHTYHMKIDTIVNINDQNKTASQLRTDNVAKSTIDGHKKDSNHVIVTPDFTDPKIKKSVAKEGENWVNDEKLDYHHQTYNYKIDFTLSDHADYTSIVVTDHLEDIQTFSGAKVLNAQGEDVTEEWEFAGFPKAGANKDGAMATADITVKAKNPAKYTRIGGTYSILLTDVTLKGAGAYDEAFYVKNGKEVVPNRAKLDWLDKTPDPNEPNHLDSNQTTVTPPNPVDVKIHKEVSVDNRRTYGEHKHLPSHDAKYHWKTTFHLSKMMNYDELILTDHFADVQAPNLDIAKMVRIDQAGKDITHKFDINTTAKENVTEIVAKCKPEFINDFDDIRNDTETELHMTIDDVSLKGVSAISEKKYIKEGIETIPNTAQIVVNPLIKEGFHQDNLFYQNKTSNEAKVDIEKPTKIDVHKKVTVDGGKNWVDVANLPNHDGNYTWKTEFTLPKYNNFEQLVLTDHFADVQFLNLNIEKMISIMQNGVDIANKFNFSTRTNGNNVDVIATVKPEHANDFDDITEDRFAKLEMIIKDVNLKHVKPEAEKKYISNGQETIPNQSTISVNPHLDFEQFKQSKDSNIAKVNIQRPTDGSVHKQVSIDKGKKWVDVADLPNHDGEFTWKTEFILPKFNNFEQFVLTERFADVQMPNLDMDKMFSITQNEEDITHKFNVTKVEDTAKHTVNIIATVKQEFVDDFDDIREDKYAKVYMTIKDIHLKHVKAETEKPFIHEGIETIPNQTNMTINPHLDFEQFKRNKDSNISKVNIKKPTPVKIHKQVSIDGGKTWGEIKDLPNHDGNYTWKTDFQLPKFNNFEQLILTDHFADVQFPNLDISKMVSVLQNGRDITSKFSFSTKVNGDNVDVIATLNPELADEFDDIQTDEEAHLEMIIKDVNLKKVKAKTEEKYINERDIEVIPNQTNIKVNPHLSFDQFKQAKDSNISKVNIIRPTDPTVGNPKDKNDRGKQVSIDGGKTWSDFKDLAKHDSLYDWKSTFNPSKYFNFDGRGSLTLTDTFEHLQTIGEVKVATMTNEQLNDLVDKDLVEIQDRAGNRISDKFTFTVEPFNKLAVTIKASVKAEFADEFDDLGGVNQGDLQTIVLYIRQATVRGATGHEEIHYLDADNRVYIPNVAGIKEDSGIKHFTGKVKTNVAKVRLPMVEPAIEKYVEADGDDSGQNHAIDQNAEQNMIMDKALERAQRVLEEVQKLSNISEDVQKAMDKLVETVAEVSSTAEDINKATEKLEERVNKALEKKNDKSEPVTLTEAQEFAQNVLKQVESLPVPYSTDVEKAKKALVDALAESTENKKEEVVAQNIQQLAEYLKKIVEKEKAKQPSEETTTSTSVEGHSTSTRHQ